MRCFSICAGLLSIICLVASKVVSPIEFALSSEKESLLSIHSPFTISPMMDTALTLNRLSYCSIQEIKAFRCEDCSAFQFIQAVQPEHPDATQMVMVMDALTNNIYISYRGTIQSKEQWWSNIDTAYTNVSCHDCFVHHGFYQRFNDIIQPTLEGLSIVNTTNQSIYITGHSSGGAVATLVAFELAKRFHPLYLFTFGSPRVGNKAFIDHLDQEMGERMYRIINEWDAIPTVPYESQGFFHAGQLVLCKTGTFECEQGERNEENRGGLSYDFIRTMKTVKNSQWTHLTYLEKGIGTGRYECIKNNTVHTMKI